MEHHGWEFVLEALVRVCSIITWPVTVYVLVKAFHQQVGGVIQSLSNVIQRISKVTRRGNAVTVEVLPDLGVRPAGDSSEDPDVRTRRRG